MKPNSELEDRSWNRLSRLLTAHTAALLLLLTLPTAVQAQFNYVITNGAITITGYTDPGGAVSIPETINGLPVTSIGMSAFRGCVTMTSVTIPDSVTSIGVGAFFYCSSLTSVTIGNSVISIGGSAFLSCTNLTSVTIPNSVTSIGDYAFQYCPRLTNATIGNSVTSMGDWTFQYCSSLTSVTIPDSATSIGDGLFCFCASLTNVTIGNSVSTIGVWAFDGCGLTSVTIPSSVRDMGNTSFAECKELEAIIVDTLNPVYSSFDGVLLNKDQTRVIQCPEGKAGSATIPIGATRIGDYAFRSCAKLTRVTIPNTVTNIGEAAFMNCTGLKGVYFQGNAPSLSYYYVFSGAPATIYYLPGTTGWEPTFGGRPTLLWVKVPSFQISPQTQTAEAGSTVCVWVHATNSLPVTYLWYLNGTNFISCSTNGELELTNVQFAQSGPYTVVVSNALGAITNYALISVIPPVPRRMVPALTLRGQPGSSLNLEVADVVGPSPHWAAMDSVLLTNASQWYFDSIVPLPPQRFYRAWMPGASGVTPALDLHMVPAVTLTGPVGSIVRVDGIDQFGPVDAWYQLAALTLTNSSQLYVDTSVVGRQPRLYRLVSMSPMPFRNLKFESATPGSNFTTTVALALPGWSAFVGEAPFSNASYNTIPLDSSYVGVVDYNAPAHIPRMPASIAERYTAYLAAGIGGDTWLAQTGQIPVTASALYFYTNPNAWDLTFAVNGENLPLRLVSAGADYSRWGVDISRFAGTLAEIRFSLPTHYPGQIGAYEAYLDAIEFSSVSLSTAIRRGDGSPPSD